MFTNEQVRTAMTGLVAEKGERHTAAAMYSNPEGKSECFLGALVEYMGGRVPREGTRAADVLGVGAVTPEMAGAFGVAQMLNDSHMEWKYVLMGVDLALRDAPSAVGCPCGCSLTSPNIYSILDRVKRQRALDRSKDPMPYYPETVSTTFATGGIVKPTLTFNLSEATASMSALSIAMNNLSTSFTAAQYVPIGKKDHALVA